jgi:hypothetical protein
LHSLLVRILPWKKGKLQTEISATDVFTSATCEPIMSFFWKYYECPAEFFLSIQSITMLDLHSRPTSTSAKKKQIGPYKQQNWHREM